MKSALSPNMKQTLIDLHKRHGGSKRIISGFKTFEALEKRGLVELKFERRNDDTFRHWYMDITEAGEKECAKLL